MELPGRKTLDQLTHTAQETLTVRRVFGEAYTVDGATVIPVATVMGGSGLGFGAGYNTDQTPDGEGGGGGFGARTKPMGVYVVRGQSVEWQPTLDLNRIILGGQAVGAIAILAWALTRRR